MTIDEKAYAKVNLSLDVLRKRGDGYHDLRMVAQTVSLCDDVTIKLTDESGVYAKCGAAYVPDGGRNLAAVAAKLFFERTGLWNGGAAIYIRKRIPVGAGLGGGSADAAAVLRALNGAFGAGCLSGAEMSELALEVGSDVPFCVMGGTRLMEGRGEILTALPPLTGCYIVICKPRDSLSTGKVFGGINAAAIKHRPDTAGMVKALENGDIFGFSHRMFNVLEETAAKKVRKIAPIRKSLIDLGARGACMTGTGTAVTGLFTDLKAAQAAVNILSKTYRETFLTEPVMY